MREGSWQLFQMDQNSFALSGPVKVKVRGFCWLQNCRGSWMGMLSPSFINFFSTVHLKELCTIPQRSLKIVTSVALTTKQWIRCIKIAATEMLFLPPHLLDCHARTAILHWLLLMLRPEWLVQAWHNRAGNKVKQQFFPGCGCLRTQFRWKKKHIQLLWKFPYLCLYVLIKNTVHEAHSGLQGAGAQPSWNDACWALDTNAGLKVNWYQMFILATLLIKQNAQSPGVIEPNCSEPMFKAELQPAINHRVHFYVLQFDLEFTSNSICIVLFRFCSDLLLLSLAHEFQQPAEF